MLDPKLITEMVEQQIRSAVNEQVNQLIAQTDWQEKLEGQIVKYVQDRILGKFSNISTIPDLVETVESSVVKMFEQGFIPDLAGFVDENKIKTTVDLSVEAFVDQVLNNLTLDTNWLNKIQTQIEQLMVARVASKLREIDIVKEVHNSFTNNKDLIVNELLSELSTPGIVDTSSAVQLTVMDNCVVVEKEFVSNDLVVANNAHIRGDMLVTGDLAIQGRINTDNETWQTLSKQVGNVTYDRVKQDFADDLIETMLEKVKEGIDVDNVTLNGTPLLFGDTLSSNVKSSSLTKVGVLSELNVQGTTHLGKTLTVNNGRIGVNTESPDSALSVWDEEVAVSIGKLSKDVAFVGTGRKQNLVIGVNKAKNIEIDSDGITTIQKLRVGRNNLSFVTEPPNYSGTKGDVAFNVNITADAPFGWICLGAFRWQPLKAGA